MIRCMVAENMFFDILKSAYTIYFYKIRLNAQYCHQLRAVFPCMTYAKPILLT